MAGYTHPFPILVWAGQDWFAPNPSAALKEMKRMMNPTIEQW
jgi:hypothetical protein